MELCYPFISLHTSILSCGCYWQQVNKNWISSFNCAIMHIFANSLKQNLALVETVIRHITHKNIINNEYITMKWSFNSNWIRMLQTWYWYKHSVLHVSHHSLMMQYKYESELLMQIILQELFFVLVDCCDGLVVLKVRQDIWWWLQWFTWNMDLVLQKILLS